jgi:soluble lytic murein transglycosylase-like protein
MEHVFKITATVLTFIAIVGSSVAFGSVNRHQAEIQELIVREANRQNFPPALALAVARVESNFDPRAKSHAGARGVMQIMPATAEQELGVPRRKLYDPETNIRAGIRFLNQLIDTYDGKWDIALSHYNGGSAVTNRWGRLRVIPATRDYVDKVLKYVRSYEQQLGTYAHPPETRSLKEWSRVRKNLDDFQQDGSLEGWQSREDHSERMSAYRTKLVLSLKGLADRNRQRGIQQTGTLFYDR